MMNKQEAEVMARVLQTMQGNVKALEAALAGDTSGKIYWFPQYHLGIKVQPDGKGDVVRVDLATVNPPTLTKGRVFRNGAGVVAELCSREYALQRSLYNARKALTNYEDIMSKL